MDVQQIVTFAIVAVAASFLGSRLWKQAQGNGCDGCGGACGKPVAKPGVRPAPQAVLLVTLSARPKRAPTTLPQ